MPSSLFACNLSMIARRTAMSVFCWFAVMSYKNPKIPHFFLFLCIICLMEFTALYRKYRPQKFDDVVGQDHIVSVLEGAVKRGEIAHAYLFSGTRGTGKTSVARILAKEIKTTATDLVEIDAASNTSVEDVRSLNESVHSLPFESKYKVYIIDEVHMLSKSAFNALLKTLEEPPKHAIFILATTELEKLPETVFSRCQTFVFQKPSVSLLKELALSVAKKEGFDLPDGAADLVALLGDGSYRDTHGILQKVISSTSGKRISIEEVERVTGIPKGTLVNSLLESIAEGKLDAALSAVSSAAEGSIDMKVFLKLLLHKARAVLLLRFAPELKNELAKQFSEEDFVLLTRLAGQRESKIKSALLRELLEAYSETGFSYLPQLPLELALSRVLGSA